MGSNHVRALRKGLTALARSLLVVGFATAAHTATAAIAFVQGNSAAPQAPQTTVGAIYKGAQAAGNLNVVAIGWYNTTAHVISVTDTAGNTYRLASGPTTQAQAGTQALYYASNIAGSVANNNQVIVSFDSAVPFPDLRIAEYNGVAATAPVDAAAASAGTGTMSNSGSATTSNANDLLIGANYVTTLTTGPGSGYTTRTITSPDGSILEDRIVTAAGNYSATAPISPQGGWIMQVVAFRAAGSTAASTSTPAPAFVQKNYAVPQSPQAAVSATYTSAQTAGDLNLIVIGWNDSTAHLQSVRDTRGNVYQLAIGPTSYPGYLTQAIYYAANIGSSGASANSVTATFDSPAVYVDLRIAEYHGLATSSPVDVVAAGAGNSGTSTTTAVSTTNANDLLIGANTVRTSTTGAGANFTNRVITSPNGDILEDRLVSATGSYGAAAPLSTSGPWVMQLVALRAASSSTSTSGGSTSTQTPSTPGSATATVRSSGQIDLSWAASTDNLGIAQYLIERCQGASCSGFAQIAAVTGTAYSNTGLTASTSYSYRVRAKDTGGNLSAYSNTASATTSSATTSPVVNTPPSISGTPPTSVNVGTAYSFSPTAADANGDPLTFSVTNLPSWATFSASSGQISGTPGAANVATYSNIVISVSDGKATTSLAPFSIVVTQVSSGTATVSWVPPSTNSDGTPIVGLAGYRIHYGTSSGSLTQTVQVSNPGLSTYVVTNLSPATYYFAVTAYTSAGAESALSNLATKIVQ